MLKKYFIPHKNNNHKPHILRDGSIAVFLGIVLISEIGFLSDALVIIPHSQNTADVIASVVVDGTNQNRIADNLPSLTSNPLLVAAAEAKANDMAAKGYFAHNSPDGKTPWFWVAQAGYPYVYAGENLAVNFYDSQDVVNAWMNSPLHRANILDSHYTDIGIASAEGTYQGSRALFVVQFFGSTATTSSSTSATASSTTSSVVSTQQASLISSLKNITLANPRQVIDALYFILFTIIAFSLLLALFIKIRIQHPRMIAASILLLIIIIVLAGFNKELILAFGTIG